MRTQHVDDFSLKYFWTDVYNREYELKSTAKRVWDDIFNNDTLTYKTFDDYWNNFKKTNTMTREQQLEHRLAMINDDLKVIRQFIDSQGYDFTLPTNESDEAWTHLNNIEIACDLSNDESLDWKLFTKNN